MDIKIAELFKESRQNSKIRDTQLAMPTSRIPDLDWKFDEDIQLVEPVHEQVYSLEQTKEKEQPITPPPTVVPMEKERPVQKSAHWKEQASSPKASRHGHHPWSLYRRNLLQENHHKEGCVLISENSTKHNQRYTT